MKEVTRYIASDGKEFSDKVPCQMYEEALDKRARLSQSIAFFNKCFPPSNANNTRYEKFCDRCNEVIEKYEREFDGHRNEKGQLMFSDYRTLLNSRFCNNCYELMLEALMSAVFQAPDEVKKVLLND